MTRDVESRTKGHRLLIIALTDFVVGAYRHGVNDEISGHLGSTIPSRPVDRCGRQRRGLLRDLAD